MTGYDELYGSFRWRVPADVNLGVAVCERQPRDAPAILVTDGREVLRTVTFGELATESNRLANALRGLGVGTGDRVGIAVAQRPSSRTTSSRVLRSDGANLLIGNCAAWPARPGSMGRPYPGHELRVTGGEIEARVSGDPVAFLGYWRQPDATAEKVPDGWLRTGDRATVDDEGYFHFVGRTDDLISSAGHRIGPGEIEECLVRHPAVALAAVIGVPDELRGEAVKAFVVLARGADASEELGAELKALVRERLAAYEVPREVEFAAELPLTVTGKIRRNELRRLEAERRSSA